MKTWLYLTVGVVIGVVFGSWAPKADLREAKRQLAELRRQAERQKSRIAALDGVRAIVPVPEQPQRAGRRRRGPSGHPAPEADQSAGPVQVAVVVSAAAPSAAEGTATSPAALQPSAEEYRKFIETASDAWRMRVELARNSFLSNVATSDTEAATFDTLMAAMNLRLGESIRRWVETIKAEGQVTPELGVRLMHDLSGIVVLGYDDLDRSLPPGWREKAGEEFKLFDFIDPQVAMPLAELEGTFGPRWRERQAAGSRGDVSNP